MPREHDDDLEITTVPGGDGVAIATAIATGLERIATVLERGLKELRAVTPPERDRPIHTTCKAPAPPRRQRRSLSG